MKSRIFVAIAIYVGAACLVSALAFAAKSVAPETGLVRSTYTQAGFAGTPIEERSVEINLEFLQTRPELPRQFFGVRWSGFLFLDKPQSIEFFAGGNDRIDLRVDGQLVLRRNLAEGTRTIGRTLALDAGAHELAVDYEQFGGGMALNIQRAIGGGKPSPFLATELFAEPVGPFQVRISTAARWLDRIVSVLWMALPAVLAIAAAAWAIARWRAVGGPRSAREYARRVWLVAAPALGGPAVLFGLSALAVALPLFEVLANGPEFLVARNTTLGTAVALVVVMCAGVPLALIAIELALARVSTRAGAVYHHLLIACLVTAMALPWFEGSSALGAAAQVAMAAAAGAACSIAAARFVPIQHFLALLASATVVVPLVFLFDPGIRDALVPIHTAVAASRVGQTPPVVFIVFDEFPLISLLDERREIDADRYPNLAAFSQRAYWFRNASAVSSQTQWAVPAIVSGRYPTTPNAVPTLRYYPNNLFTLLSSAYDMTLFGRFLQLCSPSDCNYDGAIPDDTVPALVADLAIVWLHIVLPEPYTQELPPIVGDWRDFARARREARGGDSGRRAEFDRFMATIDAKPARLYFLHSTLPHMPFEFVPSGGRYVAPDYQGRQEQGAGLFSRASAEYANSLYQRHLLQVGFVDHLLGRLFERLRDLGIYDTSLIVITADHGLSFQEGEPRREVGKNNAADVMMVPLFIKVPGNPGGIVLDDNVTTVDILPTVADVLSVEPTFEADGRPLLRPERVGKATKSYVQRTLANVSVLEIADWAEQAERSLQRKLRRFGSHDEAGLYALPETKALLGREVAALLKAERMDVRIDVAGAQRVADGDETTGLLPLYVRGTIKSSDPGSLRLAVALNGVVAATTAPFQQEGVWVFTTLVPERYLSAQAQDVSVFVIAEEDGRFMLSEPGGGSARRARR